MQSKTTAAFWRYFDNLPETMQRRAHIAYAVWQENPAHPGINFKRVNQRQPVYSARISHDYRALGLLKDDTVYWFWIGSHADYDKMLK